MENYSDVNFIKHLLGVSEKFINDQRLSPLHISLYYALFHSWNISKFRVPISISREDIMRASKIGSANTYTKCLKELDQWNYIKYDPSHNPYKGSQIHMYNFNKTNNNGSDISSGKTTKKTTAKTNVKVEIPSINTLNKTNKTLKMEMSIHEGKIVKSLLFLLLKKQEKKKVPQKKKVSLQACHPEQNRGARRSQHSNKLKITLPTKNALPLKLKSSSITIRVTVGW